MKSQHESQYKIILISPETRDFFAMSACARGCNLYWKICLLLAFNKDLLHRCTTTFADFRQAARLLVDGDIAR